MRIPKKNVINIENFLKINIFKIYVKKTFFN